MTWKFNTSFTASGSLYLAKPPSWKYQSHLCSCNANSLQISWRWTLFELMTAISEKRYEFLYIKHIIFMGNTNSKNLHIVKTSCQSMKAIIFWLSFRSLCKFTNKLPCSWHLLDLKLPKKGRKFKQSLEVPILAPELYVFTRKDLCFATCRQVIYEMFIVWI